MILFSYQKSIPKEDTLLVAVLSESKGEKVPRAMPVDIHAPFIPTLTGGVFSALQIKKGDIPLFENESSYPKICENCRK